MRNPLIGRTILSLTLGEGGSFVRFLLADGEQIARCEGDCCSVTWIEHIELPALGFPAKVLAVENLNMPNLEGMEGHDVITYYGCKVSTDRGDIILDYRNASNGFYGGKLDWD